VWRGPLKITAKGMSLPVGVRLQDGRVLMLRSSTSQGSSTPLTVPDASYLYGDDMILHQLAPGAGQPAADGQ
jgi:uncharacterized protein (DUF779 family)